MLITKKKQRFRNEARAMSMGTMRWARNSNHEASSNKIGGMNIARNYSKMSDGIVNAMQTFVRCLPTEIALHRVAM